MESPAFLQAFILTLLAGISTAFGAFLAFFKTKDETRILAFGLGFSGGVMVYLSFMEILPKSIDFFARSHTATNPEILGVVCFFVGVFIAFGIDFFIPKDVNPHELKSQREVYSELGAENRTLSKSAIHRTAIFTAIAITIHNFPEGFATFISALDNFTLGLSIAVAVAIHNIPEGLAVSLPIYHATGEKARALKLTFLSGLAEPLGAVAGYFIFAPLLGDWTLAVSFGIIAGIMVFIALDSLLPNSKLNTKGHESVIGVVCGMMMMALSLILLS